MKSKYLKIASLALAIPGLAAIPSVTSLVNNNNQVTADPDPASIYDHYQVQLVLYSLQNGWWSYFQPEGIVDIIDVITSTSPTSTVDVNINKLDLISYENASNWFKFFNQEPTSAVFALGIAATIVDTNTGEQSSVIPDVIGGNYDLLYNGFSHDVSNDATNFEIYGENVDGPDEVAGYVASTTDINTTKGQMTFWCCNAGYFLENDKESIIDKNIKVNFGINAICVDQDLYDDEDDSHWMKGSVNLHFVDHDPQPDPVDPDKPSSSNNWWYYLFIPIGIIVIGVVILLIWLKKRQKYNVGSV